MSFSDVTIILNRQKSINEHRRREMYTQAYLTGLLTAQIMFGRGKISSYEELFGEQDDRVLKEKWLAYAQTWNKK